MSFVRGSDRLDVWFDRPRGAGGIAFAHATHSTGGTARTLTLEHDVRDVLGSRPGQGPGRELAPLAVVDLLAAAIGHQRAGRYVDLDAIRSRVDESRARIRAVARDDPAAAGRCAVLLATWQQLAGVLDALDVGDTDLARDRYRAAVDFPLEPVVTGAGAASSAHAR